MDYQKKVQEVLDRAVEAGTECGCQAALYINGELAMTGVDSTNIEEGVNYQLAYTK